MWAMGATATRLTVDEYYAITTLRDRKQLVDGAIVVNEPKLVHMELQGRIYEALRAWLRGGAARGNAFLPTDVRIDEHNLYAPDVLWIAERNLPADLDCYPERIPDICVEIRSPGTWRHVTGAKRAAYERAGAPEIWLVDDAGGSVLVHRRSRPDARSFDVTIELSAGDVLSSPQLPGFALAIEELFDV